MFQDRSGSGTVTTVMMKVIGTTNGDFVNTSSSSSRHGNWNNGKTTTVSDLFCGLWLIGVCGWLEVGCMCVVGWTWREIETKSPNRNSIIKF